MSKFYNCNIVKKKVLIFELNTFYYLMLHCHNIGTRILKRQFYPIKHHRARLAFAPSEPTWVGVAHQCYGLYKLSKQVYILFY